MRHSFKEERVDAVAEVAGIMEAFARRTGLEGTDVKPKRYLWTDAFAVCNFLWLFQQTRQRLYLHQALRLVEQVHEVLGRHREDDERSGWISGLSETEGREHPTVGGLRIGKPLNERKIGEPYNEQLEWEQDGQYFHYLTKWMHALSRVSQVTLDAKYNRWAIELAKAVHRKFTYRLQGHSEKRMYWKMSIDLSRPLVSSMGQFDALDALVTYHELAYTAASLQQDAEVHTLEEEIVDAAGMCRHIHWMTEDPLGIGGLLSDLSHMVQLTEHGRVIGNELFGNILFAAKEGTEAFMRTGTLDYPPEYRLAFRELGLAIGLKGGPKTLSSPLGEVLGQTLEVYLPLAERMIDFWLVEDNRKNSTWQEHTDINSVMLATALAPEGYHGLS